MDAPQIQYTRTADGVNIAYSTYGSGPPLIYLPSIVEPPLQTCWRNPNMRANREMIGRGQTFVAYDQRGAGLSGAYQGPLSFDTMLADCRAVIDALAPEPVILYGAASGCLLASVLAAEMPDRISHLFEWMPAVTGKQLLGPLRGIFALIDQDYRLFTETAWKLAVQWDSADAVQRWVDDILRDLPADVVRARIAAFESVDVSESLPKIQCPVLLIHPSGSAAYDMATTQDVAQRIPHAQIVVSDQAFSYTGDSASVLRDAVDAFIAASQPAPQPQVEPQPDAASSADQSAFRTILFTDVEESTLLTAQYGDAKARQLLGEHEHLTRQALADHDGDEIKTMGDGFMIAFRSASGALDAAIAMQRAITQHFADTPTPLRIRVGINAGEPIAQDDDLHGTAVIQAARIMSHAAGGEILVTDTVRNLVAGKDYLFSQKGEYDLKGFEEAVRLFEVRWQAT